jgi:hypothetical protein
MTYEYTMPSGCVVCLSEPTLGDVLAAQKTGDNIEILRRCLRSIDGKPVGYEDTHGNKISSCLRIKDIMACMDVLAEMTTPSESEMGNVKASLVVRA